MKLKILYFLLSFIFCGYYFYSDINMNKNIISFILACVIISTILFYFRPEKEMALKGQFFKHSTFAILGLLIVNFQLYVDYVYDNISSSNSFIFVNPQIVIKSLVLSYIGLLLFFIGYLSYKNINTLNTYTKRIYHTFYLEILVFVFIILYLSTININYLMGGYGSVSRGQGVSYIDLIFKILIISIIVQKSRNLSTLGLTKIPFLRYLYSFGYVFNISLFIYLCTVLVSGDRGPLITFTLIVFSGYFFITKRKFKKRFGLVFLILGATLITILGIVRQFDSTLSFKDKILLATFEDSKSSYNSISPQTVELATSVKTIHHAVDYVPDKHDFLYGRFQFQQITFVIPFFNIFNEIIFDNTSTKYAGSASFVTWIYQGDYPTYGNGTSVVADFYLDFGLFGVIVGMFLFGYFMRFSEIMMYVKKSPNLFYHSFFVVYLGSALYISRSSLLFEFRTVIWVLLVLSLNKYIFNKI